MEKEDIEEKYNQKKIFEDLRHDFKNAKEAKVEIDGLISEWNEAYEGIMKSLKNRSKYKSLEIAKQIEKIKTNITEPYTNSSHPIRTSTTKFESRARLLQKYLNSEFTSNFDRVRFMEKLSDILCREGTVWVKTAWNHEERNVREVIERATSEEILSREEEPDVIKETDDPNKFYVEYNNIKMIKNNPDAIIMRNEHVFPDPSARTRDELRFMCIRKHYTISELRSTGRYSESTLDKLQSDNSSDDTSLGSDRDSKATRYGYKQGYDTKDKARNKISVIEYYGYYDINNDGIAEPIFASWAEKEDVNLILEENGMPHDAIPFYNEVYSGVSFSLWGNALAYFITDNQNAKAGIVRGIFDNMASANNGQKFIRNGTLDYVNFKRLQNGEKNIITNKDPSEGIKDGTYNQIPGSVFTTYEVISREAEELSGNTGNNMALKPGVQSEDNTSQLTMAQQMMAGLVTKISSLLGHVMKDWIKMAEVFLENEQIQALFTDSEIQDLLAFEDNDYVNISFKVGTNAQRQVRLQQLNMLMQQSKVLGENMPPEQIREIVAEMYELFDMYEKAEAIRQYKPQPDPNQIMMQQLALQEAQLKVVKLNAEIAELNSRSQLNASNSQKSMLDSVSGAKYKDAQTQEKLSKAKSHDVANALEPSRAIAEVNAMMNKLNTKGT